MPFNNDETAYTPDDFLNVDKPIPGQNYCCLSFISPDQVLKKREPFIVKNFLRHLKTKNPGNLGEMTDKMIDTEYDDFIALNDEKLEKEFHESVNFMTSVRGVKVRGVFDTLQEAEERSKFLQRIDRSHNIYLGQIGYWLPIDADPNRVSKSEYLEKELNELMKSYKDNEVKRDEFYSEQVNNYKASTSKTTHEHMGVQDAEFKNVETYSQKKGNMGMD